MYTWVKNHLTIDGSFEGEYYNSPKIKCMQSTWGHKLYKVVRNYTGNLTGNDSKVFHEEDEWMKFDTSQCN